jgi:hypothetical protein
MEKNYIMKNFAVFKTCFSQLLLEWSDQEGMSKILANLGEHKSQYKFLRENPKGEIPLERSERRCCNVQTNLKTIGMGVYAGLVWLRMWFKWLVLMNMTMNVVIQ